MICAACSVAKFLVGFWAGVGLSIAVAAVIAFARSALLRRALRQRRIELP